MMTTTKGTHTQTHAVTGRGGREEEEEESTRKVVQLLLLAALYGRVWQ